MQHWGPNSESGSVDKTKFIILTNRLINEDFKQNIKKIAQGLPAKGNFKNTIVKYTNLSNGELQAFCGMVEFIEVKENYDGQKIELKTEIAQLLAGSVDNAQVDTVTALVQEKILPHSDHKIIREEILKNLELPPKNNFIPYQRNGARMA